MGSKIDIRETRAADLAALETLYTQAFPEEPLVTLVRDLVTGEADLLSLAATLDGAIVGHVAFTRCTIGEAGPRAGLLAPLAVAPDRQRQGIGRAIVNAGFKRLEAEGIAHVYVLGDPAYYSRLGFTREDGVQPPYQLPPEWDGAWQSIRLGEAPPAPAEQLVLPKVWMRPELWLP